MDRVYESKKGFSKKGYTDNITKVTKFYRNEFKKYGYSLASLDMPKGGQAARFKTKFEIGHLDNTRVLDVGCGFGHMLDYMKAWGINAQYTGIDICPDFIEIAKQRHPDADFRLLNILDNNPEETWDWVFLVGALNIAPLKDHWWDFIKEMLERMFDLCTQGVAVDFLSTYVDFQKQNAFHVSPEGIFSFAKTLTKRVALRHDYMAYEFTIYLYRNQSVTSNHIFIEYRKELPNDLERENSSPQKNNS